MLYNVFKDKKLSHLIEYNGKNIELQDVKPSVYFWDFGINEVVDMYFNIKVIVRTINII